MDAKELIELYFSNKLSVEAQKEFDHLMTTDSEFAKEVAFQKNLKAVIKKEEQDVLKTQLQGFEAEKNSSSNYKKWFVAASLIMLLGLSSIWYFNTSVDTQKLYAENFEPYRNIIHPIVRSNEEKDIKTKAFFEYETSNYKKALYYFNKLPKTDIESNLLLYKANCYLKLNNAKKAVDLLELHLKEDNSTLNLKDKTHWYLALAYLKMNNVKNAKKHLNIVNLNPLNDYKKTEAKNILEHLK